VAGRQKEFDTDEALEKAMRVFWQKGFLGASLSDLTEAMGINKPSLYATFGNKEALFKQAMDHYKHVHLEPKLGLLTTPGVELKQRLENYITAVLHGQFSPEHPRGCYVSVCLSDSASGNMPDKTKVMINDIKMQSTDFLETFFQEEQDKGHLPRVHDAKLLTLFCITFFHGTASLARSGSNLEDVKPLIAPLLSHFGY